MNSRNLDFKVIHFSTGHAGGAGLAARRLSWELNNAGFFSKFYTLKLKGTTFKNCSLIAVDFMATDLTESIFDNCDLYRAEFDKAIANKANFKTSYNYTIDPSKTKLKKAIFSLNEVKGLLFKHEIVVD